MNADPAADALPIPTGPLQLLESIEVDARIRELRFYSPALAAETRVRVLLPVSYDASRATAYPVTYLLHGCCSNGGGYRNWTEDLGLAEIAQSLDQAFVMPEGGNGGLYSDWYNAGAGGPPRWESYHIRELLPWMEARYRLRRDRRGRSLLGISMGGHGAFAYAAKYPQYFGSAAALSPALDSNTLLGSTVLDDGAVLDGGVEDAIWGPWASEELRWRGHNPVDLAENLRGVDLFIRSGNGRRAGELLFLDIFEAAVHEMSVNMSAALQAQGIAHRFDDY